MPSLGLGLLMFVALLFSVVGFPFGTLLMYVWLDHVAPQASLYGPLADVSYALYLGVFALGSWIFSQRQKFEMVNPTTYLISIYAIWICITTVYALAPEPAMWKWDRTIKILFSSLLISLMLNSKERVAALIWTLVISVSVYILRGGLRTIVTGGGGGELVLGVDGSFIGERNTFATTTAAILPLIYVLIKYPIVLANTRSIRWALWFTFGMGIIAIVGTQSRSGMLALGVVVTLMIWQFSKQRLMVLGTVAALAIVAIPIISSDVTDRLKTVQTYEEDASAMGRINAWNFGMKVVSERPFLGGGFKIYTLNKVNIEKNPTEYLDAHSFFFEILGEHGFPGIFIFISLWLTSVYLGWSYSRKIQKFGTEDQQWISMYLKCLAAGLVAYTVGALFNALGQYPFFFLMFGALGSVSVMAKKTLATTNKKQSLPNLMSSDAEARFSGIKSPSAFDSLR
jgi:putative inorganic carbon (hco3(-)) transporter